MKMRAITRFRKTHNKFPYIAIFQCAERSVEQTLFIIIIEGQYPHNKNEARRALMDFVALISSTLLWHVTVERRLMAEKHWLWQRFIKKHCSWIYSI